MNKYISGLAAAVGFYVGITFVNAQTVHPVCGTEAAWQQAIQIDTTLPARRAQMVQLLDQYLQTHNFSNARTIGAAGANDTIYNIPIVFHIIEDDMAGDNISDAQVRNCVQIMNLDYRRKNADTVNTVIPFKPIAADTRIQFQLATIDPNGNCTNGITRSFSHRTENFDDYGKSIIDWPSDKYFNIWTVNTISLGSGIGVPPGGYVIGYAQFPVSGPSATDGVVLSAAYVGDIGTGNADYAGRDADHETGHYFNLIHTWGDADCGNDQVDDTPTEYTENYDCICFPQSDTCYLYDDSCGSPNPPGVVYQDYMDYTEGICKNLFTRGQAERMWATLNVARVSLWQAENLSATGTDSTTISSFNSDSVNNPNCAPQADFLPIHWNLCPGGTITYDANYTNGTPTSYSWSFPGGSPSTSTSPSPTITYNSEGNYPVTLTVSNSNGSSTITKNNIAIVDSSVGVDSAPFSEGFENEGSLTVPNGWNVFNDDGGPAWQRTNRAAHTGSYSMSVQNYETISNTAPGSWKELQLPSFNFATISKPLLTFYLSYGQQTQTSTPGDTLYIEASTNCGGTWLPLTSLGGTALATGSGGLQPDNFAPADSSQWSLVSVPMSFYANKDKVKLRFLYVTGVLSNNIYIDDINIKENSGLSPSGISEVQNPTFNFNAIPNPATQSFTISYLLTNSEDVVINLYDLQGRLVRQLENDHQSPGVHQTLVDGSTFNLATGLYILKMITPDGLVSKKLMYSNE